MPRDQSFSAFDRKQASMGYRRNLPHLVQDNAVYFVTFRLHDSIPRDKLVQWGEELRKWHDANPPPHTPAQTEAFAELGYRRIERWLDRCEGTCLLREPAVQEIVGGCLECRDRRDYWLGDYVVMPNHVHVLVQIEPRHTLKEIARAWYGVTTHRINRLLGRRGALWQGEPFDHIVRDDESMGRIRGYIRDNGRRLPAGAWRYGVGSLFAEQSG